MLVATMDPWPAELGDDPRPWLLDPAAPAVRHLALRWLEDRPADDPAVVEARRAAMAAPPIASILAAQDPEGWWVKPGPGYGPKYTGTTWSVIFLDQLGADGSDEGIQRACAYLLEHVPAPNGGFGISGKATGRPTPSSVVHCLNGNLLRALIGFGRLDDPRVAAAVEWEARAVTGDGSVRSFASGTSGPGFRCGVNEGLPCAWGATKALLGLARVPPERRDERITAAIDAAVELLLSVDPTTAAYPAGWGGVVSSAWFKPGFPSGYVADILQVAEAVIEVGRAGDPRLAPVVPWLLTRRAPDGRWRNAYPYAGKMWVDVDRRGAPSRWVTLRASRILRALVRPPGAPSPA
jgi:hypothetical protein